VRCCRLTILVAAWGGLALAATDLSFQPIIKEATYCRERKGSLDLRLHLELQSQTPTGVTLLLPLFAEVSGYEIYRDEYAVRLHQIESGSTIHLNDVLGAKKLSPVAPDPRLFRVIPAGERASWYAVVEIPVMTKGRDAHSLLGKDRYLRVRMNPWPAARKPGERLRETWRPHGLLWITEFVSLPLKIHINQEPKAGACRTNVD
jgi:hypothetical protein